MGITNTKVETYSHEAYLDLMLLTALEGNDQIAIWKKPKDHLVYVIIDKTQKVKRVAPQLEDLPPGFIVHPFADQEDKKAIYLEANEMFQIDLQKKEVEPGGQLPLSHDLPPAGVKAKIKARLEGHHSAPDQSSTVPPTPKAEFLNQVKMGMDEIAAGRLLKIVPARRKTIPLGEGFDLVKTYLALCEAYPDAFVNFFHIPGLGSWIGATPEVLIRTKGDRFFTMSLAGSQKAEGDNPLKRVAWTQKEIEEQALVSRYIVNCFKKIRLREYEEIGPKTAIAGKLLHLRTDFMVDTKATNFPLLGSAMLDLLHPTSAVAGMPRENALEFIHKHEAFDRSLFSGFMGPVNIEDETAIYVNLRCAKLTASQAILYAGAGVTEDSDPEKEWEETELKCDIIGKFIQQDLQP